MSNQKLDPDRHHLGHSERSVYTSNSTRTPAIVRWTEKRIGMRHIEFGASHQCLTEIPIFKDIAHVEGIPDPEPHSPSIIVDHHVFTNCERPDVFTYNDDEEDGHGNVVISYLIGGKA